MAEQLNILGLWERTAPGEPEAPPAPPVPLPPVQVDPRQEELLVGAHTLRARIEDACVALDPVEVRAAHEGLITQYGKQKLDALAWAEGLAWLLESPSVEEQAKRALVLIPGARLPGMPEFLFELVRAAALKRAALSMTEERGAAAALEDGRPAGYLALVARDFALARSLLEATGKTDPQWLGYLGEAAWGLGDSFRALEAYCEASLIDPTRIDQESLTCQPVLELLDLGDELEVPDPLSYLAVLADLAGKLALGEVSAIASSPLPLRVAAQLRAYRRDRSSGSMDEAGRIAAKRELSRLAPQGLRELLRRL